LRSGRREILSASSADSATRERRVLRSSYMKTLQKELAEREAERAVLRNRTVRIPSIPQNRQSREKGIKKAEGGKAGRGEARGGSN